MSKASTKTNEANEELDLIPSKTVQELDRYIVGQDDAKKKVSVALRNRWRRKQVDEKMREEIVPKNILMIGPTGVGKTEIGRRTAKLVDAPFIKIEATKFTEVGYVGRDVDSIIRDLVENAIFIVKEKTRKEVTEKAKINAVERVISILVGDEATEETKNKFRTLFKNGKLDDTDIEIEVSDSSASSSMPTFDIPGMPGSQMGVLNISDMFGKAFGGDKKKKKTMKVPEALEVLTSEESENLIDEDKIIKKAIHLVENDGIVFLDEIDKITVRNDVRGGEVSREGVQRDLLPLIEGTTVSTKYGPIKTDHILFIASGAFHLAKPADLLPELQGRLPIRVELSALSREDLVRILVEPEASLIKQYQALLATEGIELSFDKDAIEELAELAADVNRNVENIGARRLHTIMEKLLEDISYTASEIKKKKIVITKKYVSEQLGDITKQTDLSKFIL